MRLWPEQIIHLLPRVKLPDNKYSDWLLGQHRECCAMRGGFWGCNHSTVNYVFTHSYTMLFEYHKRVMEEMIKRGQKPGYEWTVSQYRGKKCPHADYEFAFKNHSVIEDGRTVTYPEHDSSYLLECIDNLCGKLEVLRLKGCEVEGVINALRLVREGVK